MKNNSSLRVSISFAATVLVGASATLAQAPPTFKVLYTFGRIEGTPVTLAEVSPGNFLTIIETSPALVPITATGIVGNIYYFPTLPSGLSVAGLTPALNNNTYGSAENSGPTLTFFELFAASPSGNVTTYPYQQATAGILVQSPDNHLYGFYGVTGGVPEFSRFDYQGNATPLGDLPPAYGLVYVLFLSTDGNYYALSLMNSNTSAGIFRITPTGSFSWVVPSFSTGTYGVNHGISLIQAGNGKFYGTLPQGGAANAGTIYEATLDGKIQTIHEFTQLNTGIPETLV